MWYTVKTSGKPVTIQMYITRCPGAIFMIFWVCFERLYILLDKTYRFTFDESLAKVELQELVKSLANNLRNMW